jgi:hypothetical protein
VFKGIVGMGFVLSDVGLLGYISTCIERKYPWVTKLFNIVSVLMFFGVYHAVNCEYIFIGFAVLFLIAMGFRTQIGEKISTYCNEHGSDMLLFSINNSFSFFIILVVHK